MAAQAAAPNPPRQLVHLRSSYQMHPLRWRWSSASAILDASPPQYASHSKSGQNFRNSLAITNSDYYNARRPQLLQVHSSLRHIPSAPALDTISENEPIHQFRSQDIPLSADAIPEDSETPLFHYTPTPEPARQTVPMSLSRTSTPGPRSRSATPQSYPPIPPVPQSTPASTPQAGTIPFSESIKDHFVPLYYQPQNGQVYRLESEYYVPLSSQQLETLVGGSTVIEQPSLIADRRTTNEEARDYAKFSQILMLLVFLCCDFPVLLLCSLPALICAYKVKKANEDGRYHDAKTAAEYALCFNVVAIVFHVLLVLIVIAAVLVLHFVFEIFS